VASPGLPWANGSGELRETSWAVGAEVRQDADAYSGHAGGKRGGHGEVAGGDTCRRGSRSKGAALAACSSSLEWQRWGGYGDDSRSKNSTHEALSFVLVQVPQLNQVKCGIYTFRND